MGDESATGISRRDIIKKSVVVGGLVWVAPTVLASPAGATPPCGNCPAGTVFGLRHDVNAGCTTPGADPNVAGNCAAAFDSVDFRAGCCLETVGLVTFTESADNHTHTYLVTPGLIFCAGFGLCGTTCYSHFDPQVIEVANPDGSTTVIISCPDLTRSEIMVCVRGTAIPTGC